MSDFTTHFVTAHRFLKGKELSCEFKQAMYFGVQGPDLFFYYKPLKNNDGMKFGGSIHDKSPKALFEKDILNLDKRSDFYRGYYFGVMLHFFGDEMMHQYIGYLCNTDKTPHAHEMYERDIDVYIYKDEFKRDVKTWRVKDYYKYSNKLANEIYNFWSERDGREFITQECVKKSMKGIVSMAQLFSKSNKLVVWIVSKIEKTKGSLTGHFKTTQNLQIMNIEKNKWQSPEGSKDLSVYEVVSTAISNFEKEYAKITTAIENKDEMYEFTNEHTFSYGC